jgi:hypothetical protein
VAVIGGVAQKVHLFVMDLPQSDAGFVKAYPAETTEAFLDGHVGRRTDQSARRLSTRILQVGMRR